jgi:hypothetical protein
VEAETTTRKDGVKGGAEDGSHSSHHRESELHLALRVWIGEGKEKCWWLVTVFKLQIIRLNLFYDCCRKHVTVVLTFVIHISN